MESKNQSFNNDRELITLVQNLTLNQAVLDCQLQALKYIFRRMLEQVNPTQIQAMDKSYNSVLLKVFDHSMQHEHAYSEEMTAKIRSLLKDIPGLNLSAL